ncbi:MAG: ferrous iron transport protein A [Treponema sp.]|nr:ferrous iron transport protein A [Treponema sp.]
MPLSLCSNNSTCTIKKIGGGPSVRQHLNELGFNTGTNVRVVSSLGGNLIVQVKDSRIALDRSMANKIMV